MSEKKSDEQVKHIPQKPDGETVRKDGSVPGKPGRPIYQTPTEPWPEGPKKK